MRRILLWLCLCVCAGIVCARFLRPPAAGIYCLCLALLLLCRIGVETRRLFAWSLALLALSCGCALFSLRQIRPADDLQRLQRRLPLRCYAELDAEVVSAPRNKEGTVVFPAAAYVLRVDPAYVRRCSGRVQAVIAATEQAAIPECLAALPAGQRVRLCGQLRRSWPLPVLRMVSARQCRVTASRFSLSGWAQRLHDAAIRPLQQRLTPAAAGVAQAMVLGERGSLSPLLYRQMVRTGTVHILVVSGFNVGIVACAVLILLKVLRIPRGFRFVLAAALLAAYCLVCGGSTPVVRAGVMAAVCMFSLLARRQADMLTACAFSALCILIHDPAQLFSPSFQLSYASVVSLITIFPRLRALFPGIAGMPPGVRWTIDALLVSFSAWLGTAGLIAWYFSMVSPVAVLANVFIPALASLITVCGCLLIAVSYLCPYLASPFASVVEALVNLLLRLNSVFLQIPLAYFFFDKAGRL